MTNLDAAADKAVRDAVDAYMEGRLTPEFAGETVFETKNSRYRLLDGVVFAAPDDSLVGAELVGWLMETRRRSVIGSAWQPGSRAVLVDWHRGRHIIVTSTTRLLHLEEHSSADPLTVPRHEIDRSSSVPPFSPQHAPIHAATPLPSPAALRPPTLPPPPQAQAHDAAILAQKRAAALHLPPRLMGPKATTPLPIPPPVRPLPLPLPAPPPRRNALLPGHVNPEPVPALDRLAVPHPEAPSSPWELTSSEFEVEAEDLEPDPDDDPTRHNATHYHEEASAEEAAPGAESSIDAPIPLVRPIGPGRYGPR